MKRAELYQLMADPTMLSEKTLPDLKQIVDEFPYFHAVRMLYLKNLAVVEDLRLQTEIKKMAIYIPDRMKLFGLIEGQSYEKAPQSVEKTKSFDVVENFLSKSAESGRKPADQSLHFEPASSLDYMYWLSKENQQPDSAHSPFQHQELIDSFIENDNDRSRRISKQFSPNTGEKVDEEMKVEKSLDSSYFTETLAHVYIKQKRYEKALEIIKSLSLKYPEKNVYFADQIRFLEKLIIHTKK